MVAGVGAVIFSTGTYYPQVHPQVVENPAGRAEAFDQTSSHAADMILAAVKCVLTHCAFEPDSFVVARGANSASAPSDALLGYP